MERLVSPETSALKAQTPGDYPKDTIRHSTHDESLKSRFSQDVTRVVRWWKIRGFGPVACVARTHEGKGHLEHLSVDMSIILKWILQKK